MTTRTKPKRKTTTKTKAKTRPPTRIPCPGCDNLMDRHANRCSTCSGMNSPEARSKKDLCGAKKRNGELCRAYAGQGTDHKGVGRCKNHLGSSPSHTTNAVVVEAKQRMVQLGTPIPGIHPHQALLAVLRATAGHVAWLHRQVAELEDLASHESRVIVTLYDTERDRLTRVAKACSEVGVAQAEIKIQQREAALFSIAVDKACTTLQMSTDQRRKLHETVAQNLEETDEPDLAYLAVPGAIYSER